MILRERTPERKANDNHAISGLYEGLMRNLTYRREAFLSEVKAAPTGMLNDVYDAILQLSRAEVYSGFAGLLKTCASRIDRAGKLPTFLSREETILALALNVLAVYNPPKTTPETTELDAHATAIRNGILAGRFPDRGLDPNYIRWLTVIGSELKEFYGWD